MIWSKCLLMKASRSIFILARSAGQRPEIKCKKYNYERDDKEISPLSVMPLDVVFVPHNSYPISQHDLLIILNYGPKEYAPLSNSLLTKKGSNAAL